MAIPCLPRCRGLRLPRTTLRRFGRDQSGSTAVVTAFASTALLGFLAIGIDGAHFYLVKRGLQSATDMAAMAAASNPSAASAAASAAMKANGFPDAVLQVTPGVYTPDPSLSAAARFASATTGNAVRVVSVTKAAFIFGSAFRTLAGPAQAADGSSQVDGFPISVRAVARKQDQAALTLGSGFAALDGGMMNAVLGSLLGTRLSLTALDYQALAGASVDLFGFSDALSTRGLVSGPTYGAVGASVVSQSNLLSSLASVVQGNAQAGAALRSITSALVPGTSLSLGKLVDFGSGDTVTIGSTHPFSAQVSALSMLLALAQLGAQNHIVTVDLGATIPGLLSTKLMLDLGEPAVGTSFFAAGPEGTTLHTAQVRLLLTAQIGVDAVPVTLSLPVYIEVAPATASVSQVACASGAAAASVTLAVTPGLADAWIGSIQTSDFGSLSAAPAVQPATLANTAGLLRITATGHVSPTTQVAVPVTFSTADIKGAVAKTVTSGVSLQATMANLIGGTQVSVTALGLVPILPQVPSLVTAALNASLVPIDTVIAQTLSTLGVSLGQATTTVPGVRCGQGILVN